MKKLEMNESICEVCGLIYDRTDEAKEVKESGVHMCLECWEDEE
jgi:uncharacterized protein YlaI